MDLKSKFFTIFKALNPYNYRELSEAKLSSALKYYFFIIVFSVFAMLILFSPQIYNFDKIVYGSTSNFERITLNAGFQLNNSFDLISDPLVRFETPVFNPVDNSTSVKNISDELLMISPDYISYKHYLFFGDQKNIPLVHSVDVANSASARDALVFAFMFILPSLVFWGLLILIVYFSVIVMLTFILLSILTAIFKIYSNPSKLLNVCLYASSVFIMLQLLLMPFFRVFLLPLIAYWIIAISAIFLWKDVLVESEHPNRDSQEYDHDSRKGFGSSKSNFGSNKAGSSKTREIFGSSNSSGGSKGIFGNSKKSDSDDSYDVDESGNLRGSSKKKKTYSNDDNDGYVEL